MIPLQAAAIGAVVALGTAVVLARQPLQQAVVSSFYGPALVVLFVVFQAPDVALSAMAVSAVAFPLMVLLALARVRVTEPTEEEE